MILKSEKDLIEVEIEREKGNLIIERTTRDFICTEEQAKEMSKDQIKVFLENNFKDFEKIQANILDIKWRMSRVNKDAFSNDINELAFLLKRLTESKDYIKEEVKRRDISIFKTSLKAEDINLPIF